MKDLGVIFDSELNFVQHCKAKQRRVMGVGMCLYAQLVQTKIHSAKVQL